MFRPCLFQRDTHHIIQSLSLILLDIRIDCSYLKERDEEGRMCFDFCFDLFCHSFLFTFDTNHKGLFLFLFLFLSFSYFFLLFFFVSFNHFSISFSFDWFVLCVNEHIQESGEEGVVDTFDIEVVHWSPRIISLRNFLKKEECEHLIKLTKERLERSTVVGGDGVTYLILRRNEKYSTNSLSTLTLSLSLSFQNIKLSLNFLMNFSRKWTTSSHVLSFLHSFSFDFLILCNFLNNWKVMHIHDHSLWATSQPPTSLLLQ